MQPAHTDRQPRRASEPLQDWLPRLALDGEPHEPARRLPAEQARPRQLSDAETGRAPKVIADKPTQRRSTGLLLLTAQDGDAEMCRARRGFPLLSTPRRRGS